jgi:hypothetical protein
MLSTVKELLPDEDVRPTHTPPGVDADRQAETLQRLRGLENRGRQSRFQRDDLIVANSLSHSLTRRDMGRAIGVTRSRIDQIIASHSAQLQSQRNATLADQARRHVPPQT